MADMFDFSDLTPVGTARFSLGFGVPRSSSAPVILIGKHAGRDNPGWINAVMTAPDGREGGARTADQLDADDIASAKRMAKHVLVGWENVFDATPGDPYRTTGALVPTAYSTAKAEEFLIALITAKRAELVRAALGFFANPDHFRDAPAPGDLGNG